MYVACFVCLTLPLRKKRKAINIYFDSFGVLPSIFLNYFASRSFYVYYNCITQLQLKDRQSWLKENHFFQERNILDRILPHPQIVKDKVQSTSVRDDSDIFSEVKEYSISPGLYNIDHIIDILERNIPWLKIALDKSWGEIIFHVPKMYKINSCTNL